MDISVDTLVAEWIDCMSAYRLYDLSYPEETIAYVDKLFFEEENNVI